MNPTYKAGDQITIRSWQDMMDEFGSMGHILINDIYFTDGMQNLCENIFFIHSSTWHTHYGIHIYRIADSDGMMKNWWFTDKMFQSESNSYIGLIPDRSFNGGLL